MTDRAELVRILERRYVSLVADFPRLSQISRETYVSRNLVHARRLSS